MSQSLISRNNGPARKRRDADDASSHTHRAGVLAFGGEPRVAIAHDYLTQRGGAERVVLAISRAFPNAPVYTSFYNPDQTYDEFRDIDVRVSPLNRVQRFRNDPRLALPVLSRVWNSTVIRDVDVVICSSTGWAHGVRTAARKLVYCHNPARWLYQGEDYLGGQGAPARAAVRMLSPRLRRWDRAAAATADVYLANSTVVSDRVQSTYGLDAEVVHPPAFEFGGDLEPVLGVQSGFLLTVGRQRGYKNTETVYDAVIASPHERLVIVGGVDRPAHPRVTVLQDISDGQLRWLYARADALVACAFEDFGLTPVEGFALGTPALCLRAGGYLDTMVEGVTGEFIEQVTPAAVRDALRRLREKWFDAGAIREHAGSFTEAGFAASLRARVDRLVESDLASRQRHPSAGRSVPLASPQPADGGLDISA